MTNSPDTRLHALSEWLNQDLKLEVSDLCPASSDASFRRYFRAQVGNDSFIVMDAPPTHEDVIPFVNVSNLLRSAGVQAPKIHAQSVERGFLLLCDFGSRLYLDSLNVDTADSLYDDAMQSLIRMKRGVDVQSCGLPNYDEARLRSEMDLFGEWFLGGLLDREINFKIRPVIEKSWRVLVKSALDQPKVCVHRDYHSRNLMITDTDNPGVLDFQDAVIGPITYDLVSLLRDCYITWPKERVEGWVRKYHARLIDEGLVDGFDADQFLRWFDLMGLQRHIKVLGIFSRLYLRDGKASYLKDIPRTLNYVVGSCQRHPEMADFLAFLQDGIVQQTYFKLGQPS